MGKKKVFAPTREFWISVSKYFGVSAAGFLAGFALSNQQPLLDAIDRFGGHQEIEKQKKINQGLRDAMRSLQDKNRQLNDRNSRLSRLMSLGKADSFYNEVGLSGVGSYQGRFYLTFKPDKDRDNVVVQSGDPNFSQPAKADVLTRFATESPMDIGVNQFDGKFYRVKPSETQSDYATFWNNNDLDKTVLNFLDDDALLVDSLELPSHEVFGSNYHIFEKNSAKKSNSKGNSSMQQEYIIQGSEYASKTLIALYLTGYALSDNLQFLVIYEEVNSAKYVRGLFLLRT